MTIQQQLEHKLHLARDSTKADHTARPKDEVSGVLQLHSSHPAALSQPLACMAKRWDADMQLSGILHLQTPGSWLMSFRDTDQQDAAMQQTSSWHQAEVCLLCTT